MVESCEYWNIHSVIYNMDFTGKLPFSIMCRLSDQPAELFVRNENNRLVPLTRASLERIREAQKRLLLTDSCQWRKPLDELPLDGYLAEYEIQEPDEKEKNRRSKQEFFGKLELSRVIWTTQGIVEDSELTSYLPEGKKLEDFVVSRSVDCPKFGIHAAFLANISLNKEEMQMIWELILSNKSETLTNINQGSILGSVSDLDNCKH